MLPLAARWHFGPIVTVASKEDSLWIFFLLKDCLNYGNLLRIRGKLIKGLVVEFAPSRVDLLSKFSKILFREREKSSGFLGRMLTYLTYPLTIPISSLMVFLCFGLLGVQRRRFFFFSPLSHFFMKLLFYFKLLLVFVLLNFEKSTNSNTIPAFSIIF